MKMLGYLENVPNFAATVCNKEGIVLYQNKRAIDRDGDVVGKNLYNCHGEKAGAMIRHMIEPMEQREQSQTLLELCRVATEEDRRSIGRKQHLSDYPSRQAQAPASDALV